ncbi:MAG: ParB/RepB/Spo0J family partition protein [Candidatus Omnitrophica bacterium]|nr:ParB/RepB/Spo0J family partition protein [Candidatus Omnitrophota bacterium]
MEKRKALGRGLQALIPEGSTTDNTGAIISEHREMIAYLDISEIKTGKYQPRSDFNQDKLKELIASIKEKGIVQPILVKKTQSGYELIAGERRLRAAKAIGIKKIPVIAKEVDDASAIELALIENIQREDLNPIEEARAYERLGREFNLTQERIAQAVGKDRTSVTNTIRLLNLSDKIQQLILNDMLTMGHARALLSIPDARKQIKLAEKIIKKGLSVRETEQLVKPHAIRRKTSQRATVDPHTRAAEEELQQALGTKVNIHHGKKRGKLVIEYYSPTDLERIIGIIKR